MKEIRESDWFSQASQAGINVSIKESPHSMFGRNT
jgi:peptide deformylase